MLCHFIHNEIAINGKLHKTAQSYLLKIPPLYSKRFPAIIKA